MTLEERSRLETLDTALRSDNVREHIRSVVARVRDQLASQKRGANVLGADSVGSYRNDTTA